MGNPGENEPGAGAAYSSDLMNPLRSIRGAIETAKWLEQRGLDASKAPHWHVEIEIPSNVEGMTLELRIYQEEWGYVFRTPTRASSIRVTDQPFVHGADDLELLPVTPPLDRIGDLIDGLQRRFHMSFHRTRPTVRSNLPRATSAVRTWLSTAA